MGPGLRRAHQSRVQPVPGAVGSFNWSGIWGTYFWIDPVEKLIGVLMIQVPPDAGGPYRDAFRHLAYAALSVPQPPLRRARRVSADILESYVGTYDFGPSLSAHDRQAPIPAFAFAGVGLDSPWSTASSSCASLSRAGPRARAGVKARDVVTEIDGAPSQRPASTKCSTSCAARPARRSG